MPWTPNKPDGSTPTSVLLRWLWERIQILDNIRGSSTVQVSRTTRGITLYANPPGAGSPASPVQQLTIAAEHDDYLMMTGGQLVAKPWHLRRSAYSSGWQDGQAGGVAVPGYPQGPFVYVAAIPPGPSSRTTSNGFSQYINRRYNIGDTLNVCAPQGGVGSIIAPSPVTLLDLNVDARQWFIDITDCIQGAVQQILVSSTAPYPAGTAPPL